MLKRYTPIAIIIALLVGAYSLGLHQYLNLETLQEHRETLQAWTENNPALAPTIYIVLYALVVALSIPGGTILTLAGGFLYGTLFGTSLILIGATLGATVIFIAAQTAFAETLHRRAGPLLRRMEKGFQEDQISYMLVLRLVPIFPFWAVNLAPALLGVPLRTYMWTTFIGIIPGTLVYASVGNGLGTLLEKGETPDLGIIFSPDILLPLLGLSALAMVPALYKKLKKKA